MTGRRGWTQGLRWGRRWQRCGLRRQLLWLAHAESYTHREIAEITGLGVTSIRLLLFRARREMARLLQQGGREGRPR